MIQRLGRAFIALSLLSSFAMAVDLPGGISRTANTPTNTYELMLSPSYALSPGGAYLSSQFRMQMGDEVGVGLGFGAGELGFNFGGEGVWFIAPDTSSQPAVALVGGMYFNRLNPNNYFQLKVTPIVSKTFKTTFGKVTPYAGMQFSPSFRLNTASNDFSMKISTGAEFAVSQMNGLKLWSEVGFGVLHAINEIVFGISYPFTTLGS
jgi:hypothetical protein